MGFRSMSDIENHEKSSKRLIYPEALTNRLGTRTYPRQRMGSLSWHSKEWLQLYP